MTAGWSSADNITVDVGISWTREATVEDPVRINLSWAGDINVTSGTSVAYNTQGVGKGTRTVIFARTTDTLDVGTITVAHSVGAKMINASARGWADVSNAMDLNLSGITGNYKYRVRDCTTPSNSDSGTVSTSTRNISTGEVAPTRIAFIEVLSPMESFSAPDLSPDSCTPVPTPTPTPTTTTEAPTTTTEAPFSFSGGSLAYSRTDDGGCSPAGNVRLQLFSNDIYNQANDAINASGMSAEDKTDALAVVTALGNHGAAAPVPVGVYNVTIGSFDGSSQITLEDIPPEAGYCATYTVDITITRII